MRLSNFSQRGLPHAYNGSEQMRQDIGVLLNLFCENIEDTAFLRMILMRYAQGAPFSEIFDIAEGGAVPALRHLFKRLRNPNIIQL